MTYKKKEDTTLRVSGEGGILGCSVEDECITYINNKNNVGQ